LSQDERATIPKSTIGNDQSEQGKIGRFRAADNVRAIGASCRIGKVNVRGRAQVHAAIADLNVLAETQPYAAISLNHVIGGQEVDIQMVAAGRLNAHNEGGSNRPLSRYRLYEEGGIPGRLNSQGQANLAAMETLCGKTERWNQER
jgi:hypothetical protein